MRDVLAIGPFTSSEIADLKAAFDPVLIQSPAHVASIDGTAITAVAYRGHAPFGPSEMDRLPALKLIANYGVGYDAIDMRAAQARAIEVTNTPDVLTDDVADLAVGMLLAQARAMEDASAWLRDGQWAKEGEFRLTRKVSGGRVGILGLGRIGTEIAARLAGFKMDIHYWARADKGVAGYTYHSDPVALARAVDYLIVALVGGAETANFASRAVIDALGPTGILINISRGSCVDEIALIEALENRRIAGAALDVFQEEPAINPRLLALDNVLLQPHHGSGTVETRAAMAKLQRDNIHAHLAGQPLLTPVS